MNFKSHTKEEILSALRDGKEVYVLDTGNDGEDDVLIGGFRDVMRDIVEYHEIDILPDHWGLRLLDWDLEDE